MFKAVHCGLAVEIFFLPRTGLRKITCTPCGCKDEEGRRQREREVLERGSCVRLFGVLLGDILRGAFTERKERRGAESFREKKQKKQRKFLERTRRAL